MTEAEAVAWILIVSGVGAIVMFSIMCGTHIDGRLEGMWEVTLADGSSVTGAVTTDLYGIVHVHRADKQVQPVLEGDIVRIERIAEGD